MSCDFCWLNLVKFLKNTPKRTFLKNAPKVTKLWKRTLTKKRLHYLLHNCHSVINSSASCVVQVMQLLRVELSECFEKRTQKYFFEKCTQSYQTLNMYFDQKKAWLFATQKPSGIFSRSSENKTNCKRNLIFSPEYLVLTFLMFVRTTLISSKL